MAKKYEVGLDLNGFPLENQREENLEVAPTPLGKGHRFFNTTTNQSEVWDGTAWVGTAGVGAAFDEINLTPKTAPAWTEGLIYYDSDNNALTVYDDESESSLQVGQELRVRVFNNTGVTIPNGSAVTVVGVQPNGSPQVELAIASDATSAINTVGIATHDIEAGTEGWATTAGVVNGVDSSAYTTGAAIYLSETVAGAYQETQPSSPSYEVRMGGVIESNATTGKYYAELRIISNDQDNTAFFNGAVLEPNSVVVTSNGTTVNVSLNSDAANNKLSLVFGQNYVSVADGINIDLTLGTDTVPVENWVYIDSAGTITQNTTGFPSGTAYVPVARVIVPSAATAQTQGVYKSHAYTDHLKSGNDQGHLSHLNEWIRQQNATWISGALLTSNAGAATLDIATSLGKVLQLHSHSFPAFDTATGSTALIVNDPTTPYLVAQDLTQTYVSQDINGTTLGDAQTDFYNLVIWGVVSEDSADCQLMVNLPDGAYSNNTADVAVNDEDSTAVYTIPTAYRGAGFLIARLTIQETGGTYTVLQTEDLRGLFPSTAAGGGVTGGSGAEQLSDLTDVGVTTPTDKNVLVANGTTFESRALVSADISDLTGGDLVDDTTPQLGGDLDVNGNSIVSAANGDINIAPNGTGDVVIPNGDLEVTDVVFGNGGVYCQPNKFVGFDDNVDNFRLNFTTSYGGVFEHTNVIATGRDAWVFEGSNSSDDLAGTSGNQAYMRFNAYVDQSGSAGYTGIKLDVTETATGSGENLLMDLAVGGTTKFSVDNTGQVNLGNGNDISQSGNYTYISKGLIQEGTSGIWATHNSSFFTIGSSADVRLYREATGAFAQRSGTTAQEYKLYNTYTNSSNYERLALTGNSITVETAGTGADDIDLTLTPAGGGSVKVENTLEVATAYTVATLPSGTVGQIARISDGDAALAWGATAVNSGAGATPYLVWYNGTNWIVAAPEAPAPITETMGVYLTAKDTDATAATAVASFRMPACTITDVRLSCTTAPTGSTAIADINEGGVSILSTKLSIDATELTSTTAATAAVISDSTIADHAAMTVDIDQIGSTVAGQNYFLEIDFNRT